MGWMELVIIVLLGLALFALVLVLRRRPDARALPPDSTPVLAHVPDVDSGTDPLEAERERLALRSAELERQGEQFEATSRELSAAQKVIETRSAELEKRSAEVDQRRVAVEETFAKLQAERDDLRGMQAQLVAREEVLARRTDRLEERLAELERRDVDLDHRAAELERGEGRLQTALEQAEAELGRISELDRSAARVEVLQRAEHDARLDAARLMRDVERSARADADRTARRIITTAIQRLAAEQTSESVVTAVVLPSEEMKGRIIGREGRNIRSFEQITGVNVLIDDTPETVLLSSFDPVRREAARVTLEALVEDGRIHPARIEEVHERSVRHVADRCLRAAEDAVAEVGITDLAPDLLPVLGALEYRTSYGQNVLRHSLECAHLGAMMATELGLEPTTTRRACFLHDIGKALTHEVEGPHAQVGADLLRRHGEDDDVVHAVAAHHNEIEPETVEALLVQAADAISGSRPGARRESLEAHVRRLSRLEQIAAEQPGVDRAFAMKAGRELRIIVLPDEVDDIAARALAKEVARAVEDELTYPGEIRVTVVRESRATAVAH